jgi:hypothetical protein
MRSVILGLVIATAAASGASALTIGQVDSRYRAVVDHFGSDLLGLWALHPDYVFSDVAGTTKATPTSRLARVENYVGGKPALVAGASAPASISVAGPTPGVDHVGWEGRAGSRTTGRWMQTEADIGLSSTEFTLAVNGFVKPFDEDPGLPQQVLWYVMEDGDPLRGDSSFGVVRSDGAGQLMSRIRLDDGTNASRRGLHAGEIDDFEPTIWDARAGGDPNAPSTDREVRSWQEDLAGVFAPTPFTELETNVGAASLTDGRLVLGSTSFGDNSANSMFTGAIIALGRLTLDEFERDLLAAAAAPVPWVLEDDPAPEQVVPLPAPFALLGMAVLALAARARRKGA